MDVLGDYWACRANRLGLWGSSPESIRILQWLQCVLTSLAVHDDEEAFGVLFLRELDRSMQDYVASISTVPSWNASSLPT